jgi:hypothetical protein
MHLKNVVPKVMSPIEEAEVPFSSEGKPEHYLYPFLPGVRFFKLLAIRDQKNKLKDFLKIKLNIVDTLVFNEKDMPLFCLKTCEEGFLVREDINRNEDLIKLFKQNPEFNHEDDVGAMTKDLCNETRNKKNKKRFILTDSNKEHLTNRFRKKTKMIGKLINGFVSKAKKEKEIKMLRLYDNTFHIIQKEKNRRLRFEKEPFVVVKRGSNQNNRICNSSTFLTEKDFFDQCFGFMNSRDDMFVVQKYVKAGGCLHSIVRGCYSSEEGQSFCYVINNKEKMYSQNIHSQIRGSKEFNFIIFRLD